MPIVTIKYNLPDEEDSFKLAQRGPELYSAAWEFSVYLRSLYKYPPEDFTEKEHELVEKIREKFFSEFGELLEGIS